MDSCETNRDHVVRDLRYLKSYGKVSNNQTIYEIAESALELLKEQEATMVIESENMYTGLPITHCPKCGISLDRYLYGRQHEGQINYCPMCGQAVKWE